MTRDTIAEGALTIYQREDGYRFGLDAVLLATDLPGFDETGRIVELGAAQGIVALSLASQHPEADVLAVERQDSLFELLEQNIRENDLADRVEARHA
ncbi:MAG: methyltransferase, partial [Bradymonadaceae bacterium]